MFSFFFHNRGYTLRVCDVNIDKQRFMVIKRSIFFENSRFVPLFTHFERAITFKFLLQLNIS